MGKMDVEKLLTDLNEGRMLIQQTFEGVDVEVYLDEEEVLRACREQAFKQTLACTSEPELAGYVSDDIGLIGAALLQGAVQDLFVNELLESYRQGRLPLR